MKQKKQFLQTGPAQIISRSEILLFRNSLKLNICVELLQDGYHRSFSELFSLLTSDQDRRAAAEPGSDVRLQTPLDEQREKLETMSLHLRRAEQAENTSSWTVVCEQRLLLGLFFSSLEDFWLALHFFHSCAEREGGSSSGPATEALVCLAEVYLQRGELQRARQQAELCIRQADEDGWLDSNHRPLRLRARGTLWRICSRLADAQLEAADLDWALKLLHEGHEAAAGSEDKHLESEACYRLGLTYQSAGDHGTAKQICSTLQDADGMGKSYKAMASEGNPHDQLQYLEKMADIYRSSGLKHGLADALLCLGNIYFKRSQYITACEFFRQSCELSFELEDPSLLQKAQVWLGCARARSLMRGHGADVEASSVAALRRLLTRKETRGPGPQALPLPGPHADE
ncbi:tetratricopeptide repeat protein 29 isoform X2 [Cyclopterus lumpus]|uniref:tetratricopeptide repeat protein 29 isoform X2 n=1 Tax=Cyclopterus lumpus TaxID=8103 RepID=UPI00148702D3|nr:tetratricopeptide repeat protein 29 isoform X2 [Cyclopterus lumpus]